MNSQPAGRPEPDGTSQMLRALADGSVAGLATYHLWKLQLREIRALPEPSPGDRDVRLE